MGVVGGRGGLRLGVFGWGSSVGGFWLGVFGRGLWRVEFMAYIYYSIILNVQKVS